ncbi:rho GTPase-activating protein 28 isoform X2 [Melanotaenia boesemani]|uniref:rho GTPase-activating protein 28 isoform X2 n=1 Tax=Melanotaenia boesemani TaxID=1250792 RepID=UPI001C04A08A|nr:rho GTPase-activating protein 28 isoform X2 [Melanotaenia boesemani]XP_041824112.1 rho GTPase-activating protein 28 isoform X2 [Melanotaenia boesemani]
MDGWTAGRQLAERAWSDPPHLSWTSAAGLNLELWQPLPSDPPPSLHLPSEWTSSRTERRMMSSPSTTSLPTSSIPSLCHTATSDPRHVTMETYWREVQSIEEEREEEEEEEDMKSMDEVEMEAAWLMEAGLSSLVTSSARSEETAPPVDAVLSTLTRQQAATVRKRLDNYNETLRKRNRQPIRDVRDVFTEPDDDSADQGSSPSQRRAESPPSRYHNTTKTIRRSTHRVRPTLPAFVFEDHLPEHPSSPTHTNSPTPTHSPPHTHSAGSWPRRADWLVRDTPYSEGVAEHKRGGTCWDCLRFHGGKNSELQFVSVSPSQGLTCADDLSSRDLTRLGFISHIELSTLPGACFGRSNQTHPAARAAGPGVRFHFHIHGLNTDSGVFGVPLISLLENDRKTFPGIKVPFVFQKLLSILELTGLQTEGILRVPGSAARLKYLRQQLDRCCGAFDWSSVRQVDAAGLMKLFIRELPTPLLTHTLLSTYHSVIGLSSEVHQIQALQLLSLLLPEVHRDTLRALLVFLRKVVSYQDQNRMSLCNVSMVMAPNLFAVRNHGKKHSITKQQEEMEEAMGGAQLIQLMIKHQDLLWIVPHFLLSQVRQMNQVSNQKPLVLSRTRTRLLRRKNEKNDRNQITELCEGVIRIHAPLHTKVSMAIQLDEQTTAKDVTCRFQSETSPVQHLYEVGGNICERRLHPDCRLLDVYKVNPCCDWLLKP